MRILLLLLCCSALCAAPKAVVFDFGGVIAKRNPQPLFELIQTTLEEDFKGDELFWALLQEEDFWHAYAAKNQKNLPFDWMEQLEEMAKLLIEPTPGMDELIAMLKAEGYLIALLSNTTKTRSSFYRSRGHYDPFELTILSCEVDVSKPDHQIYRILLEQLDLLPEECIFIDDREVNVKAARELGISAIHFSSVADLIPHLLESNDHRSYQPTESGPFDIED